VGAAPEPRPAPADEEALPFVAGLVVRGSGRVGAAIKGVIRLIPPTLLIAGAGIMAVAIWVQLFVLSVAQSPGFEGVVRGIFAGGFVALLFAGGAAWTLMWAMTSGRSSSPASDGGEGHALEEALAPTLRELRIVRADVIRKVKQRSMLRVPLGIAGGAAFWALSQLGSDPPDAVDLLVFLFFGALAGEVWAIGTLDREYRQLYKRRVLPQLAARFGALTYRAASTDRVHALTAHGVFKTFDHWVAEDEIVGTYRGLPLSIVELQLERRSGKDDTSVVFDGLLVDLVLPRNLAGITAVTPDAGMIGNLKARLRSGTLEHVRLEDPRFDQHYQVYATDQIEARALLTPAFMERFVALASQSRFSLPGGLAEGNRFVVALPKRSGGDLFEPPSYWKPAGGTALVALHDDIAAVLRMADAVIQLDFWASGAPTRGRSAEGQA
jgi:hypothetical protein